MDTTCDEVRAVVQRFLPVLRFGSAERFFPVSAESWLGHHNDSAWSPAGGFAGTAILEQPAAPLAEGAGADDVRALARGGSAGNGHAVQLTADPTNADAIGNPAYSGDFFLDVGGWKTESGAVDLRSGNAEYLYALFAGAARNLNPALPAADPPAGAAFSVPPATGPVIHASVEWGGAFARLDRAEVARGGDHGMLPLGPWAQGDTLDRYFVITYNLLYPVQEDRFAAATAGRAVLSREGQWEAIAVVFRADRPGPPDANGMPSQFVFENGEPVPKAVMFSQGYLFPGQAAEKPRVNGVLWRSTAEPTLLADTHVVSFVTVGTHKNLFAPSLGTPAMDVHPHTTSERLLEAAGGVGGFLVVAGIAVALCGAVPVGAGIAIAGIIVAALLALAALIAYLIELASPPEHRPELPPSPLGVERDNATGDGPSAVPAGIATPGSGHGTFGVAGRDPTATSDVTIDGLTIANLLNPTEVSPCSPPVWRSFNGRWGVSPLQASTDWAPGTHLVPRAGRSHGYWALAGTICNLMDAGIAP